MEMDKKSMALDVVAKISGKPREAIKPEMELVADLGIDSPKGLQLLAELEDTLKIQITDEDAAKMNKVQDILNFVSK